MVAGEGVVAREVEVEGDADGVGVFHKNPFRCLVINALYPVDAFANSLIFSLSLRIVDMVECAMAMLLAIVCTFLPPSNSLIIFIFVDISMAFRGFLAEDPIGDAVLLRLFIFLGYMRQTVPNKYI